MGLEQYKKMADLEEELNELKQRLTDIENRYANINKEKSLAVAKSVFQEFAKFFSDSEFKVDEMPKFDKSNFHESKISASYKELKAELQFSGYRSHVIKFEFRYPPYNTDAYDIVLAPVKTGLTDYNNEHDLYENTKIINREKDVENIKREIQEKNERLKTYTDEQWMLYLICKSSFNPLNKKVFETMHDLLSTVIGK